MTKPSYTSELLKGLDSEATKPSYVELENRLNALMVKLSLTLEENGLREQLQIKTEDKLEGLMEAVEQYGVDLEFSGINIHHRIGKKLQKMVKEHTE